MVYHGFYHLRNRPESHRLLADDPGLERAFFFLTFDTVGNSFSLAFMMLIYADVSDTQQIAVILYWYYDIIYIS